MVVYILVSLVPTNVFPSWNVALARTLFSSSVANFFLNLHLNFNIFGFTSLRPPLTLLGKLYILFCFLLCLYVSVCPIQGSLQTNVNRRYDILSCLLSRKREVNPGRRGFVKMVGYWMDMLTGMPFLFIPFVVPFTIVETFLYCSDANRKAFDLYAAEWQKIMAKFVPGLTPSPAGRDISSDP